ncbi:peptidylprolyl isomerase SurA [Echinimonas agarilytica]|uniref:Chaperone SurA n=1 Tax=Echinimonas agarilytica TaxID=1215918 RepID=A0AA42B989_9GAMM|nr:peptidylprolyl isomerase SurA [Echinimonas agarilytica]MCM2681293.1 peptidylprolyl isomerase SurA [Echinimonas agarilytica]
MKKTLVTILAGYVLALSSSIPAMAAPELMDRVVVRVNNAVVLESEVDRMLEDVKQRALMAGQSLPRDLVLRTQITERLINRQLQMSTAERMGLRISDAQLDQTIANIARQDNMTVEQMRATIERGGMSFQQYREDLREELVIGDVTRIAVRNRINVSPQEIDALADMLQEQSETNREINFGHIMVSVDAEASKQEIEDAQKRIDKILDLLQEGADFRRQATASSQGPKALEGGDWGWMNINEAPTIFSEPLQTAEVGELIGPIRSPVGFHILTVFEERGAEVVESLEVNARHILLQPSIILSETKAKSMLTEFSKQLQADDSKFAELAEEYSEDPGSAAQGGDLGWGNPDMYVPEFSTMLKTMEIGAVSEPFRTSHGWHIVQLLDKRTQDATKDRWRDQAYQMITNRKFNEESALWLAEMRETAYIDVLDEEQE